MSEGYKLSESGKRSEKTRQGLQTATRTRKRRANSGRAETAAAKLEGAEEQNGYHHFQPSLVASLFFIVAFFNLYGRMGLTTPTGQRDSIKWSLTVFL